MKKAIFRGKPKSKTDYYEFSHIWPTNCNGGFVYGSLIVNKNKCYICVSSVSKINSYINNSFVSVIEVIPDTVGQYTGLTDVNGKKIFEGDILVLVKGATYPFQIKWDGLGWKMYRADGKRIKEAFECDEIHHMKICEIIGNIHDNPELLEVQND